MRDMRTIAPLLPYELENSSYWMFGVRAPDRDDLMLFLKQRGIATGVHYMPLPLHPLFKGHREEIPVAMREWPKLVTLPLFVDITNDEIDYVLEALHDYERRA
jgi:perosamine synthetase